MATQFERFPTMAALIARGVELAQAGYTLDHLATDNDDMTGKRPMVIAHNADGDMVALRFNAFCDDSVDFYGKRAAVQANECAEALCEQIAQRAIVAKPVAKRVRKAARKAMQRHFNTAAASRGDAFYMLSRAAFYRSCLTLHAAGIARMDRTRNAVIADAHHALRMATKDAYTARAYGCRLP